MSSSAATLGRYQLERRIASGGMADVYLARQGGAYGFEKRVALKVLKQEIAGDDENVKMFIREALVTAEFRHPNLAQVYEVGEEGGRLFIAMELIRGVSLAGLLRGLAEREKGMPMNVAVRIAIDVLDGLAHAHEATDPSGKPFGLVHRDVSPQNIMVAVDGSVKMVDFGIARAELAFGRTMAPKIKGKFSYMAPEQWEPDGALDARADVFALGVVLYEMTTGGIRLFRGDSPRELYKAITLEPIPDPRTRLDDYPEALARIVMRSLERGPAARWPSARAMKMALLEFAQGLGWSLSSKAVADTVREALGNTDVEARWEPVGDDDANALAPANDVVPPGSSTPSASARAFTVTAPGETGVRGGVTRANDRPRGTSRMIVAVAAILGLAIGGLTGFLLARRRGAAAVGNGVPASSGSREGSAPGRALTGAATAHGEIRIRGFDTVTTGRVAALLVARWQTVHPEIRIELAAATSDDAIRAVATRRADVAITTRRPSVGDFSAASGAGVDLSSADAVMDLGRAVAFVVVHNSNPRTTANLAMLRAWFHAPAAAPFIPGPAEPPTLRPLRRAPSNDLLALVDAALFEGGSPTPAIEIVASDEVALRTVSADPRAVSILPLEALQVPSPEWHVVGTDPGVPAVGSRLSIRYWQRAAAASLFTFSIFAVTAGAARGDARAFLDWLRAPETAQLLLSGSIVSPDRNPEEL